MATDRAEVLICGGGIVGLALARELVRRGRQEIVVLEKETAVGRHASGRNSGVLHAGIYYAEDSLRAKLCLEGNRLMKQYCREHELPVLESGKVIVAKNVREVEVLRKLERRARANGASVGLIDEQQLASIEPLAKTAGTALYSRDTAVVDPNQVLSCLYNELLSTGKVTVRLNTRLKSFRGNTAVTDRGAITFRRFINAAGAYSDTIAHQCGIGMNYQIVPFKGIYRKLSPQAAQNIRGCIYPVPDIRNPFLGVHFTRSIAGDVCLGPTAIPVLGRENYGILKGISREAPQIMCRDVRLFMRNSEFRTVALTEPRKYLFHYFFADARALVHRLEPHDVVPSDKAGIRPQLMDRNTGRLVTDYLVISDGPGIHILNAISPAFTSSFAFARFVVDSFLQKERP